MMLPLPGAFNFTTFTVLFFAFSFLHVKKFKMLLSLPCLFAVFPPNDRQKQVGGGALFYCTTLHVVGGEKIQ